MLNAYIFFIYYISILNTKRDKIKVIQSVILVLINIVINIICARCARDNISTAKDNRHVIKLILA